MRAIDCPLTSEELRHLVQDSKLTDKEIADKVSGGTIRRVQTWRKRYGIGALHRWERHDLPPIDGKLRSLLVGSMLGDGRLVHRVHATHYSERHCGAQEAYLKWKADLWGPWAKEIKPVPDKRGFTLFRMETHAHAMLNPWQERFYSSRGKGWKRLVPEIVDMVDPFALAIWYLDDGHAGWWPSITFGMDPESRKIALSIFDKFGLQPRWQSLKRNNGQFHMEREDTAHRFLDLIRPHVPECMSHKTTGFGFMGPHYEVRGKVTPEILREMAGRGVPIRRMALDLGIGQATVSRYLVKLGIAHPRKVGRPSLMVPP